MKDIKRAEYFAVTDEEALDAFRLLSQTEGLIPALEPAHALAYATKFVPTLGKNEVVIMNLSGRGDKDVETVSRIMAVPE